MIVSRCFFISFTNWASHFVPIDYQCVLFRLAFASPATFDDGQIALLRSFHGHLSLTGVRRLWCEKRKKAHKICVASGVVAAKAVTSREDNDNGTRKPCINHRRIGATMYCLCRINRHVEQQAPGPRESSHFCRARYPREKL